MCRDLAEVCRGSFCVGDCRIHPVLFKVFVHFAFHLSPIYNPCTSASRPIAHPRNSHLNHPASFHLLVPATTATATKAPPQAPRKPIALSIALLLRLLWREEHLPRVLDVALRLHRRQVAHLVLLALPLALAARGRADALRPLVDRRGARDADPV